MGFPRIISITPSLTALADTFEIAFPAQIAAARLCLLLVSTTGDSLGGVVAPSGFTSLLEVDDGANCRIYVYAKSSVGNEDGTTVTFTPGDNAIMSAQMYTIAAWKASGVLANDVQIASVQDTATATVNPPALNPATWVNEDTLWIVAAFEDINELTAVKADLPHGYDNAVKTNSGNRSQILTGYRSWAIPNEDPGAFRTMFTSGRIFAATIGIRPSVANTEPSGVNDRGLLFPED